ncbi:hypothetical protein [Phaeobacter sp. HF9A]|uniref:hypothetical protein n=1 Tax=Phaeobacter sp. HF9A TaxID=2721561 RepID=UPI00142FB904|nr:hypothetical protein [Phaeobacter sp. HF9A]NIZ14024.1 hypothetical protein [Phaeobacter sp. HF9A]
MKIFGKLSVLTFGLMLLGGASQDLSATAMTAAATKADPLLQSVDADDLPLTGLTPLIAPMPHGFAADSNRKPA